MGDEIAKTPSWEDRQKEITKQINDLLEGKTVEDHLAGAAEAESDASEAAELATWYTDAYDAAVLASEYETDSQIQSDARRSVRSAEPEKFERLRELEKRQGVRNVQHQSGANAAHASVVEANLRTARSWA